MASLTEEETILSLTETAMKASFKTAGGKEKESTPGRTGINTQAHGKTTKWKAKAKSTSKTASQCQLGSPTINYFQLDIHIEHIYYIIL
jgi:hypothetical protein